MICVWLTGIPGSGKSTIASRLQDHLNRTKYRSEVIDGDVLRQGICRDLGFSKEDRMKNIERATHMAKLLVKHNVITIMSLVSPYREMREYARREIGPDNFIEVYVYCPLSVAIERDPKGLYKRALAGEIPDFTGVDDPYEEPDNPDLIVRTHNDTEQKCMFDIFFEIERRIEKCRR